MIGIVKFTKANLLTDYNGNDTLTLELHSDSRTAVRQIINDIAPDKLHTAKIAVYRAKRTLNQNAYLWILCQRIAEVIRSTKEEVYQRFIKAKGQFDVLCIKDEAAARFAEIWRLRGIGWFCDIDESEIDGWTNVICYNGSSVYDTAEMAQLLDEILQECKNLNISTDVEGYFWEVQTDA